MPLTDETTQPIRVESSGEGSRLQLSGAINAALAVRFREAALAVLGAPGPVTIDLARTEYLDGAALQVLLALRAGLEAGGRSLKIVALAPSLEDTLRAVGLAEALGVESYGAADEADAGRP